MIKPYLTSKRLFFVWLALAALLSWGTSPAKAASEAYLRVAVASNFIAPAKELAARFEDKTGVRVVLSAGSTGKLYAQIMNGAPFDVFLAANAREPQRLFEEGLGTQPRTYALGRLALWCIGAENADTARSCLDDQTNARLAIANPRLAPYGQAAETVIFALGGAGAKIVTGENIAQTFQMAWSGNVPMAFVSMSQIFAQQDLQGAYWPVPAHLHAPIDQQGLVVRPGADAQAFLDFLHSADAKAVIRSFGYEVGGDA